MAEIASAARNRAAIRPNSRRGCLAEGGPGDTASARVPQGLPKGAWPAFIINRFLDLHGSISNLLFLKEEELIQENASIKLSLGDIIQYAIYHSILLFQEVLDPGLFIFFYYDSSEGGGL